MKKAIKLAAIAAIALGAATFASCTKGGGDPDDPNIGGKKNRVELGGDDSYYIASAKFYYSHFTDLNGYDGWAYEFTIKQGLFTELLMSVKYELRAGNNPNTTYQIKNLHNDGGHDQFSAAEVSIGGLDNLSFANYVLAAGKLTVTKQGDIWELKIEDGVACPMDLSGTVDYNDTKTFTFLYSGELAPDEGNDPVN